MQFKFKTFSKYRFIFQLTFTRFCLAVLFWIWAAKVLIVGSEHHFQTRVQFYSLYIESKGKKDFLFWVVFFHNIKNFARLIIRDENLIMGWRSRHICAWQVKMGFNTVSSTISYLHDAKQHCSYRYNSNFYLQTFFRV